MVARPASRPTQGDLEGRDLCDQHRDIAGAHSFTSEVPFGTGMKIYPGASFLYSRNTNSKHPFGLLARKTEDPNQTTTKDTPRAPPATAARRRNAINNHKHNDLHLRRAGFTLRSDTGRWSLPRGPSEHIKSRPFAARSLCVHHMYMSCPCNPARNARGERNDGRRATLRASA